MPEPEYLRPEEIAAKFAVSVQTVRNWCVRGVVVRGRRVHLRRVRLGNVYRIPAEAWEEFYQAFNGEPPPAAAEEHARRKRAEREDAREVRHMVGLPWKG